MQRLKNLFIIVLIILLFSYLFYKPVEIANSINSTLMLWAIKIVPSLLPMIIIISIIIKYRLAYSIGSFLHMPLRLLFNSESKISSFAIVSSFLSGCPANAKTLSLLDDESLISSEQSKYLINHFTFMSPIYIITTVCLMILNNSALIPLLLLSHYIPAIIMAIFNRPKIKTREVVLKKESLPIVDIIQNSLDEGINIMISILGFMIFFNLITFVIVDLNILDINFTGFIEIGNGINSIKKNDIFIKALIIAPMLSFLSISIHFQLFKIYKFNYFSFFKTRLIHALLSMCFIILFFDVFS